MSGVQHRGNKMKKKIFIMTLFLLMIMSLVGARECLQLEDASSNCDIITLAVNNSNKIIFDSQICNITTWNPSGTVDANEVIMTNGSRGEGLHNYTFAESTAGVWNYKVLCKGPEAFPSVVFDTLTISVSTPTEFDNLGNGVSANHTNTQTILSQSIEGNSSDLLGAITTNASNNLNVLEQSISGNHSTTQSILQQAISSNTSLILASITGNSSSVTLDTASINAIWNLTVSCSVFTATSPACILWSIETYGCR